MLLSVALAVVALSAPPDSSGSEGAALVISDFSRTIAPSGAVVLTNDHGRAVVGLVGATILSYVPANGSDVFFRVPGFCSESKAFPHGGMPVAWPWFGRKDGTDVEEDLHGFARMLPWKVVRRTESKVTLELLSDERTKAVYDHEFRLASVIELKERLSVSVRFENTGSRPMKFRSGFHPFFRVSDNSKLTVRGLEGLSGISAGMDRAYRQSGKVVELMDVGLRRTIVIGSTGGDLVNVWNDFAQWPRIYAHGGGKDFCCIEPMIWAEGSGGRTLAPGEGCELSVSIGVRQTEGAQSEKRKGVAR